MQVTSFIQTLQSQENENFKFEKSQLSACQDLIKIQKFFFNEIGDTLKLRETTIHLGFKLLQIALCLNSDYNILQLAVSSMIIAGKASELNDHIPKFSDLKILSQESKILKHIREMTITLKDHIELERKILHFLDWKAL